MKTKETPCALVRKINHINDHLAHRIAVARFRRAVLAQIATYNRLARGRAVEHPKRR